MITILLQPLLVMLVPHSNFLTNFDHKCFKNQINYQLHFVLLDVESIYIGKCTDKTHHF